MSNYNSYGVHISKQQPKLKKGDTVKYKTSYRDTHGKLVYFYIYGKWDGTKATFNDKEQHVVRTTWWLEKVSLKERWSMFLNNPNIKKYIPFIPIIGVIIVTINPAENYGLSNTLKSISTAIFQTICITGTILLIILLTL